MFDTMGRGWVPDKPYESGNEDVLVTPTTDEYELLRMQVADEIARLFQSKHPAGWEIDVNDAVAYLETYIDKLYAEQLQEADSRREALQSLLIEPLYLWDLFTKKDLSALRLHVARQISNEESIPVHRLLRELKRLRVEWNLQH